MSGNILFLAKKIFEMPPFFQTRPGDLGKKKFTHTHFSLRFSALKHVARIKFRTQALASDHAFGKTGAIFTIGRLSRAAMSIEKDRRWYSD